MISPEILIEVFKLRDTPCYNLWHTSQLALDQFDSGCNGREPQIFRTKDLEANTCRK